MLNSRGSKLSHSIMPQNLYRLGLSNVAALTRDVKKAMSPERQEALEKFKWTVGKKAFATMIEDSAREMVAREQYASTLAKREEAARNLAKEQTAAMIKAGLTSSIGYNFYDLRGPAYLIYPVNTPIRNSLARVGRVNDGYGTAAHWIATRNFGTQYVGVLEGQRNALATPDENPYVATYKEIGVERGVTFTAEFAGEGYTDNVADEHIRGLHELWLGEEGMMLGGNSGTATGNNGFVLGTANTPVAALVTATGNIPNATTVSCRVVELTLLGYPNNAQYGYQAAPTVAAGLTPSFTRTNYDGSTTVVNGGTGAVSAASNVVTTDSSHQQVKFTVTPKPGAIAWAWYVDVTDASSPTAANALLSGITSVPNFTYNLATQPGTQTAAATGLNADHSFNGGATSTTANDFDGLLTYAAQVGAWVNLSSGTNYIAGTSTPSAPASPGIASASSLTAVAGGRIKEFEQILSWVWTNFQATVQTIWCSADAKQSISDTITATVSSVQNAQRFVFTRDQMGNLLGGFNVSQYYSQFAMDPTGATAIPIRIHPMLPPGTIYFDVSDNPYPQSRLPFVRGMLVQRDYYSIEWPLVTRQWTFGTYCHEVLAHNVPWITAVLSGVGAS